MMKSRIIHPSRLVRVYRRWWRMPDQYLFRYEVRWAGRWLVHSPGVYWVLISVVIALMIMSGMIPGLALFGGMIKFLSIVVFICCIPLLWFSLMQERAFLLKSHCRLEYLALSRFKPGQIWPALLTAPVMIPAVLFLLGCYVPGTIWTAVECLKKGRLDILVVSLAMWALSYACVIVIVRALSVEMMNENFKHPSELKVSSSLISFGTLAFSWFFLSCLAGLSLGAVLAATIGILLKSTYIVSGIGFLASMVSLCIFIRLAGSYAAELTRALKARDIIELYHARQERK